jgi:hypothetical protein
MHFLLPFNYNNKEAAVPMLRPRSSRRTRDAAASAQHRPGRQVRGPRQGWPARVAAASAGAGLPPWVWQPLRPQVGRMLVICCLEPSAGRL